MTTSRSDELLVGIVALALLPMIALRILRGLRERRLPVYRTYLHRGDSAAKFNVLLLLHTLTFIMIALAAADLLLGLGLRDAL